MPQGYPGYLMTLEGGEGGGKTNWARWLYAKLVSMRLPVVQYSEPGSTAIGDQMKSIIHSLQNETIRDWTEAFVFQASRAQLAGERIIPDLKTGKIAIVDRFADSSIAYQGYGKRLGCGRIDLLNQWSTDGLVPDLTLLFDLEPEVGLGRKKSQGEW